MANTRSQWNRVTPLSKSIALVLFVALPFVGFYLGMEYGINEGYLRSAQGIPAVSGTTGDYYSNVAEWQTATDDQGGFTIAYPIDFSTAVNYSPTPSTDWRVGANNVPGIKAFTLVIPSAFEPQTNFADATLTVGESGNSTAVANCLLPDANGPPLSQATSTVMINGVPFTVFHSSDAGAGNYYETTSYRTLHSGECYAVEYTIHSAQIANYPSSYNLQPLNESMLTSVLDHVVGTFQFN